MEKNGKAKILSGVSAGLAVVLAVIGFAVWRGASEKGALETAGGSSEGFTVGSEIAGGSDEGFTVGSSDIVNDDFMTAETDDTIEEKGENYKAEISGGVSDSLGNAEGSAENSEAEAAEGAEIGTEESAIGEAAAAEEDNTIPDKKEYVSRGTEEYRGFIVDNVFHSVSQGDIHYNVYIPEEYDGGEAYALYFTLPGYEGLYFQGAAANIKSEEFGFEAQKYNPEMIVVAPQLSDWGETSANQTIALAEYFLEQYNIDKSKVYGSGFSGGGETMSIVMWKRPDLFSAYLQVSSKWDGEFERVVKERVPVYFAIGENDEYYSSKHTVEAYNTLYGLYRKEGLSDREIEGLLVLDVKEHSYFTDRNMSNEHGGGGLFAFDEEIMGWLFSH